MTEDASFPSRGHWNAWSITTANLGGYFLWVFFFGGGGFGQLLWFECD